MWGTPFDSQRAVSILVYNRHFLFEMNGEDLLVSHNPISFFFQIYRVRKRSGDQLITFLLYNYIRPYKKAVGFTALKERGFEVSSAWIYIYD